MNVAQLLLLLAKLGPKVQQAWPYIQQIIDAVQNLLALVNAPSAAGKPDAKLVAELQKAGASQEQAEQAATSLAAYESWSTS